MQGRAAEGPKDLTLISASIIGDRPPPKAISSSQTSRIRFGNERSRSSKPVVETLPTTQYPQYHTSTVFTTSQTPSSSIDKDMFQDTTPALRSSRREVQDL
eukprot:101316-Amphidinium_carterae.1